VLRKLGPYLFTLVSLVAAAAFAAVPASAAPAIGLPAVSEWPQFGQSPQHLNTNPNERTFTVDNVARLRTRFTAHFGENTVTEGGPVVSGGVLYIPDFDGVLSAFSAQGCGLEATQCEPLWRGHTDDGGFTSTPAVGGGLVLIASSDHILYAFAAGGCGSAVCPPKWRGKLAAGVVDSSVSIAGDTAYVGDAAGHLYAFAAAGCGRTVCSPLWVGQGLSNELLGAPAVANGRVYVSTFLSTSDLFTGRLLVFSASGCGAGVLTCRPLWTADIGGPASRAGAPTVTADTVFVGSTTLFGEGTNTNFHLFAFAAAGCAAAVCKPLRTYDTGDGGVEGAPAVAGNVLYATTQNSPDPNTIGVVAAYPLAGCGKPQCEPLWTGVNFAAGFASAPSVTNGVVFVGKGPASGFPVDAGVYAFDARGCGAVVCDPIAFVQLGEEQLYQGAPLAVAEGEVFMATNDNTDGRSKVYALSLAGL
jgi:outer membrane protein assembly factor BamB